MTKEEIIALLSTELNKDCPNGITCLMVEDSGRFIPVVVHHKKEELIVEVGEENKQTYRIGWNELD